MSATGARTHCLNQTGAQASRVWSSELRGPGPEEAEASRSPSSYVTAASPTRLTEVPNTCHRPGAGWAAATGAGPPRARVPEGRVGPGAVCEWMTHVRRDGAPGGRRHAQPCPAGLVSSDGSLLFEVCPCGGSGPAGGRQPWAPRPGSAQAAPRDRLVKDDSASSTGFLKG